MTEQTSLFAYEPETPADVVARIQADAQAALEEQKVTVDV